MGELLKVARRNLRQYLSKASFSLEVDKQAALACLDVIEEALPSGNATLVAIADELDSFSGGSPEVLRDHEFVKVSDILRALAGQVQAIRPQTHGGAWGDG